MLNDLRTLTSVNLRFQNGTIETKPAASASIFSIDPGDGRDRMGYNFGQISKSPGSVEMKNQNAHRIVGVVAPLAAAIAFLSSAGSFAYAESLAVYTKSAGNPIARATRAGADQVAKANG